MSRFDGHRVYNGCPDSTLQARLDEEAKIEADVIKKYPTLFRTYFPIECKHSICSREKLGKWKAYESIVFCDTKSESWLKAKEILDSNRR